MILKIKTQQGRVTIGADRLKQVIRSLSDGYHAVEVKDWKNKRSLNQNAFYWKILEIIGDHLGYYKSELHEVFLDEFAPIQTVRNLKGKPVQKPVRSSKMNVEQMTRYMEQIIQFAAENNIVIPDPELTT